MIVEELIIMGNDSKYIFGEIDGKDAIVTFDEHDKIVGKLFIENQSDIALIREWLTKKAKGKLEKTKREIKTETPSLNERDINLITERIVSQISKKKDVGGLIETRNDSKLKEIWKKYKWWILIIGGIVVYCILDYYKVVGG